MTQVIYSPSPTRLKNYAGVGATTRGDAARVVWLDPTKTHRVAKDEVAAQFLVDPATL